MGKSSDLLRSLVRGFAEGAGRKLGVPFHGLSRTLRDAFAELSSVNDREIAKALTRVSGVREASAVCRDERIWIEATFDEGDRVSVSLQPLAARFAPRGAKEVSFRLEPSELAGRAEVRDLIGAIAALIAHTLWAPFFGRVANPRYDAIAERDGGDVRVDLRSVPAVRAAAQRGLMQLFDVLELGGLAVTEGALRLHIRLPALMAPP